MQNNFYQLGANEGEACAWLVPKITFPEFIVVCPHFICALNTSYYVTMPL